MTKFLAFYPLCSIGDHKEYLGLSPDCKSGTVINTLDRNIVLRIQLSNQQQIQSWTAVEKLSNKVVYDYQSKEYVGVFANKYLRCWGQDVQNIKDGRRFKLAGTVEEIISFDGKHTILVYKDGTCESLESSKNERRSDWKPFINEETHQIINVACFNTPAEKVMLTYFVRNKSTGDMEFVYFNLDQVTLTPEGEIHKMKIGRHGSTLSGFTVVKGQLFPSVMTIWSDKRIFMLPIRDDEPISNDVPGDFVAMFNCLKVNKPLAIVSVSTDCVAIYGGNEHQDGSSLVLFNTRYYVVQCRQSFKVHLDNSRLWVVGKYILTAFGQELSCASFRISEERLSDLIGSKRSIEFGEIVDKDSINEESELEERITFDKGSQHLWNNKSYVQTNSASESSTKWHVPKLLPHHQPLEVFDTFIDDMRSLYMHNVPVDIVHGDSLLSELVQAKTVNHVKDRLYSIEEIALLTGELEKCGTSEYEITEHVIPLLIKAQLSDEIAICLHKYTNVSDKMLAKSLKFFTNMEDSPKKLDFINRILSCSFNETTIKQHLRINLNLKNVIFLLTHIHNSLMADEVMLDETPQLVDNFDCDIGLMNWFAVILDAHYQQFILSRDLALLKLFEDWKTQIDTYVTNVRDLKSISATIYQLIDGKSKRSEQISSKLYSVEMVKLY